MFHRIVLALTIDFVHEVVGSNNFALIISGAFETSVVAVVALQRKI